MGFGAFVVFGGNLGWFSGCDFPREIQGQGAGVGSNSCSLAYTMLDAFAQKSACVVALWEEVQGRHGLVPAGLIGVLGGLGVVPGGRRKFCTCDPGCDQGTGATVFSHLKKCLRP